MKCLSAEELIAFAENPGAEGNAGVAAHIFGCPECRADFRIALSVVKEGAGAAAAGGADGRDAREAVSRMKRSGAAWRGLCGAVSRLRRLLDEGRPRGMVCLPAGGSLWRGGAAPVFCASSGKRGLPGGSAPPVITFESYEGREGAHYWKMQMTFPPVLSDGSPVVLKITDARGAPIPGGTLFFLGRELPAAAGAATLRFSDFKENLRDPTVRFRFADGFESPGVIQFLSD